MTTISIASLRIALLAACGLFAASACGDPTEPGVQLGSGGSGVAASGGTATLGVPGGGSTATDPLGAGGDGLSSSGGSSIGLPGSGGEATGSGAMNGAGGQSTGSGGGDATVGVFHVFLLMGQSNMAGYDQAIEADKVENPRITVLGFDDCAATGRIEGEWDVAVPPLHECWNGALGPGDYFAKTIIDSYPSQDTIGLVPLAVSGSKVEPFLKASNDKYDWIIDRAQTAIDAGGVIEGILFHQGESNTNDAAWPGKVATLIADIRADLGLGNMPFLPGELLYSGGSASHNARVAELPNLIENTHIVSAEGLMMAAGDEWNVHFSRESTVTFGERYASTMISALGL